MWEMCEVIPKILLLWGLFFVAWIDYRTQLINVGWLLLIGVTGLIFSLLQENTLFEIGTFTGMLVGFAILVFAWISGESIGFGDGWLFVATGTYLSFVENLILLFGSMVLAGIFAIVCLVLKKKHKNDRLALAPFVLIGYVVLIL